MQTVNAVEDVQEEEEEEKKGGREEGRRIDSAYAENSREQLWPTAQRRLLCSGIRNTRIRDTPIANRDLYLRSFAQKRVGTREYPTRKNRGVAPIVNIAPRRQERLASFPSCPSSSHAMFFRCEYYQ